LDSLRDSLEAMRNSIAEELAERCKTELNFLKTIPQSYRMTNKPAPTRALVFVGNIIEPLRSYLGQMGGDSAAQGALACSVVAAVCQSYSTQAGELIATAQKTEESLRKLKASRQGGMANAEGAMSDVEKIRLQVQLDVQEFGRQITDVCGVPATDLPSYTELVATAAAEASAASGP